MAALTLSACASTAQPETPVETPTTSGAEHTQEHHGHRAHDGHHGQGHQHDFSDVERFAAIFDAPDRDSWQKPAELVAAMGLQPGAIVADVGAGTGYFLRRLSDAVGPEGHVHALDVEPAMVEHMEERITREGMENVSARVIPTDEPALEDGSVDAILIVDTWHHISDRASYAAKLLRALRPGGVVWIVDFTLDAQQGPPVEMRLAAEQIVAELTEGGLQAEVVEETMPHQYLVRAIAQP